MHNYFIQIECLSDICVSDGGVYNSSVDVDVCYDEMGLPYIPARRLKGCLRECAQELNAWNEQIAIKEIFGMAGNEEGNLKLENAYLKDIKEIKKEIEKYKGHSLVHFQNVLRNFTYLRTQTSVDYHTGTADENSLRTMRVVKKGVVFIAQVSVDEKYKESLEECCLILDHIGVSRTRGLGEVRVSLKKGTVTSDNVECEKLNPESRRLDYEILLEEPVICKSVNGQETRSMDYIDGSKILGIIAQRSKADGQDAFLNLMQEGELICSNAYISKNGERYTEVPACLYGIKNNKTEYIDKIYTSAQKDSEYSEQGLQLNSMKHCYSNYNTGNPLQIVNVAVEERYHHRRPDDKAVGHVVEDKNDESVFYQTSAICKNQIFSGYICGLPSQIRKVYQYLAADYHVRIGQSKSTEYGKAVLRITKTSASQAAPKKSHKVFAVLQSPAIIYNEKAMYSTRIDDLRKELLSVLGIADKRKGTEQVEEDTARNFVKYVTVGGFNVTWGYRKPMVEAFDQGTVVEFSFDTETEIEEGIPFWIGERCSEGYGEVMFFSISDHGQSRKKLAQSAEDRQGPDSEITIGNSAFLKELADKAFRNYIQECSIIHAERLFRDSKWGGKESVKPTISNMILMSKEMHSKEELDRAIESRYEKRSENKQNKKGVAKKISDYVEKNAENILKEYIRKYKIADYNRDLEWVKYEFICEILLQLKYLMRGEEKK